MNLDQLLAKMHELGATRFLAKKLAPNDNSKNQFYVGGSSEVFSVIPPTEIKPDSNQKGIPSFKATLDFYWLNEAGEVHKAPHARLIYYPQYPEVRLSSLIQDCIASPGDLLASRNAGRVLVLGVANDRRIFAFAAEAPHSVAQELLSLERAPDEGVFLTLHRNVQLAGTDQLLFAELCRIARKGWLAGKRLDRQGHVVPCNSPNCGGYTLEAELGISANGYSEPDFLGWEVKSLTVKTLNASTNVVITLLTPEPSGGVYVDSGPEAFIRLYGYPDLKGRVDRLNFGGIFRVGACHERTGLTMKLDGVDTDGRMVRSDGHIALLDKAGTVAASWSFTGMLEHWNRKHSKAAFVPNIMREDDSGAREYSYSHNIWLGAGTDFGLLLKSFAAGTVYYDPGIKLELASSDSPRLKRRSQFRTQWSDLGNLYHSWIHADACSNGRINS